MSDLNTPQETPAPAQMEVETPAETPAQQSAPAQAPETAQTPSAATPAQSTEASTLPTPAQGTTTAAPATTPDPTVASTNADKPEEKKRDRRKDMPIRQYLDTTVVPVLLAGMSQLTKERPDTDEIEWLANWMLKNNPNKKAKPGM